MQRRRLFIATWLFIAFIVICSMSTRHYRIRQEMNSFHAARDLAWDVERLYHVRSACGAGVNCQGTGMYTGWKKGGILSPDKKSVITVENPAFNELLAREEFQKVFVSDSTTKQRLSSLEIKTVAYSNGRDKWSFEVE